MAQARPRAAPSRSGSAIPYRPPDTGLVNPRWHKASMRTWSKSAVVVTLSAAGILLVTMGARQSLGPFLSPPHSSTGLGLTTLSFPLAAWQLTWGVIPPVGGAV